MPMSDAIINDAGYAPASVPKDPSKITFDSGSIGNLVGHIAEGFDVPPDWFYPIIGSDIKISKETQEEADTLTRALTDEIKKSEGDKNKVAQLLNKFSSDLGSLIIKDVKEYGEGALSEISKRITWNEPDKVSSDESENLSVTKQTFEELKERVTDRIVDSSNSGIGSMSRTVESMGNRFSEGYSPDEMVNNLFAKPASSLIANTATNFLQKPLDILANSDTFSLISNPTQVIGNIIGQVVSNINSSLREFSDVLFRTPMDALDNVTNTFSKSVTDYANAFTNNVIGSAKTKVSEFYESSIRKVEQKAVDKIKEVLSLDRFSSGATAIRPDDNSIKWRSPDSYYSRKSRPVDRKQFKVNTSDSGMSMANDLFWDVTIVPHRANATDSAPPDLNEIFNCTDGRLPILSYSLEAGGLSQTSFEIYPGVVFSVPLNYSRPSMFNISIVNLLRQVQASLGGISLAATGDMYSCIDRFRDDYIKYVVGESVDKFTELPACLDYHYCAYEITVTKFSPQWIPVKVWRLLGIPIITISDQGSSSSVQEIQSLTFSIVGQKTS